VRRPLHGEHEKRTGQHDADWPDWYAEYIVREQPARSCRHEQRLRRHRHRRRLAGDLLPMFNVEGKTEDL
jgi:hypothetical protein